MSHITLIPVPDNLAELSSGSFIANPTNLFDFPKEVSLGNLLTFVVTEGQITSSTITQSGSGYADGSYINIPAVGGSGSEATFDITISGGAITVATINNPGKGYQVNNELTFPSIPGGGSGELITVNFINAPATYQLDASFGIFTGPGAIGLVPDPVTSTNQFLRDDGTWAIPNKDIDRPIQITAQRSITSTDSFNPATDHLILADASAGTYNVNLPPASSGQYIFTLKKTDGSVSIAFSLLLVAAGGDNIDGDTQVRLRRYDSVTVVSNGINTWSII